MNTAEELSTRSKKQYISKNMERLGKGSSRVVYETGDKKTVVKYAIRNNKGVAQNRSEYETYENAKYDDITILCPVIEISDNYEALIMGKAISLKSKNMPMKYKEKVKEFRKKLRFIKSKLANVIGHNKKPPTVDQIRKIILKQELTQEEKKILRSRLFKQICELVVNYILLLGDVISESSWGLYRGRFKLIDYGCTREIFNKYYNT